jgi:hypothetical protein
VKEAGPKDDDKTLVRPSKSTPPPKDTETKVSASKENSPPPAQNKVPLWGWAVLVLLTIFIILMALLLVREMKRPLVDFFTPGQTNSRLSS